MATIRHNILFLNSIDKSIWGGLEHWMEMCGTGLADKGHNIWFAGREDSEFLRRVGLNSTVKTIPMQISGDFKPATINILAGIFKEYDIDVVLCNFVKDVRLAGAARKLHSGAKIIWTPGVNLAKKSLSHKFLMAPFVDSVIVPSKQLRDEIVESGFIQKEQFELLPIGIDENLWIRKEIDYRGQLLKNYNLPDDAIICVTSGRFVEQKGHTFLIQAAVDLKNSCPRVYYLFLGNGPLEQKLKDEIALHNLQKQFRFCGLLDNHQDVIFGADLSVHPAIVEPFGIVLVEAMAASLPVVATRVGGIPEVVCEDESAILVEPSHTEELTTAIERLYNDNSSCTQMGQKGYQLYQKRFRKSTMIDSLDDMIDRIILQ
ncbi:MAG: glycosyltransferase family 4 protein [candidate division Zixibacteria bacterium]|nr:glycosyltransferase family 4 protein [candidate division Zixibacteria bacterium]